MALSPLITVHVVSTGISTQDTNFNYPAEYVLPNAKRVKTEGTDNLLDQHPELAYPDTDAQYTAAQPPPAVQQQQQQLFQTESGKVMTEDEYIAYCQQYYGATAPAGNDSTSTSTSSGGDKACSSNTSTATPATVWEEFVDDDSGATYFFNAATGESSWGTEPPS